MSPEQKTIELRSAPGFPWVLFLRWLVGIYLVGTSILGAHTIVFNWARVQDIRIIYPDFNLYPLLIAWSIKLACGILMFFRSKWLLILVPAWMGIFIFDFVARNTFSRLPSDFFLAVALQGCILSFVVWMHGRGRLK